jgi:hypothetical protein
MSAKPILAILMHLVSTPMDHFPATVAMVFKGMDTIVVTLMNVNQNLATQMLTAQTKLVIILVFAKVALKVMESIVLTKMNVRYHHVIHWLIAPILLEHIFVNVKMDLLEMAPTVKTKMNV